MKIYEFQAKKLFKSHNIPTPLGENAKSIDEVKKILGEFPKNNIVIKAQVHTGGRGKAGGIKLSNNYNDSIEKAEEILSMKIKDLPVSSLLIEERINIDKEFYLSFILDRDNKCYKLIFSPAGGIDIEDIATNYPEKLYMANIDYFPGLQNFHINDALSMVSDLQKETLIEIKKVIENLYKFFIQNDTELAEINPLVITKEGKCIAADAKVSFDENALFRHKELKVLKLKDNVHSLELEADEKKLNYIKLDGNVGCMVNGAGLAMATMDVIKHFGGDPANFLDIGGGAKSQQVEDALSIIIRDEKVKSVFVNIFGGIVRCDLVAEGIISAKKKLGINIPMVIRLIGTNDKKAYKMLKEEGISVFTTMSEAAKEVVKTVKIN